MLALGLCFGLSNSNDDEILWGRAMRVLVACEFSGIVREAFRRHGHDAWSCDLLPTEIPGNHIQGDVLEILNGGWDLMVAHPPCTYLCNSGVRWLEERNGRREALGRAIAFFYNLWDADIPSIAIENPIPHKHACLPSYQQIIQPYEFGEPETKATCLWLRNLPPLFVGVTESKREDRIHRLPPSEDRAKERSRTFPGIAEAMAAQWGHTS